MNPSARPVFRPAALALAVTAASTTAWAQPTDDINRRLDQVQRQTRLLASPDLAPGERALIDYGALLTLSYFSTDVTDGRDGLLNRALRQYDLNLYTRFNLDYAHEVYARGRFQYRDYNPGDESLSDDDGLQGFVEEAYYRFNLARHLAAYDGKATNNNLVITAGRQFVDWGAGLTLTNYLDGGQFQIDLGPLGLTLLAGVTPYNTTDFDTSRPRYEKSTYRAYYGGMVGYQVGRHRPYAFVLVQRDHNKDRSFSVAGADVNFDYNSHYVGIGSAGSFTDQLVYTAELVYQGGSTLSAQTFTESGLPIPQTDDDIHAWAAMASVDYLFADARRSRVGAMFAIASGDSDRGDASGTFNGNEPGTTDRGFNGLGLISAGYAFAPQLSNLMVLKGSASTFPFGDRTGPVSRLQLGSDLLLYGKTRRNAPIDELTSDDRFLGTEWGAYANWRILEDVTTQVRYGIFFPGEALFADDDPRQFVYISLTYAF